MEIFPGYADLEIGEAVERSSETPCLQPFFSYKFSGTAIAEWSPYQLGGCAKARNITLPIPFLTAAIGATL
jgi:hypothetical protein